MKKEINVLDTSVLIQDPTSLFEFGDSLVVIPDINIAELNELKDDMNRLRGLTAQQVLKYLDEITAEHAEMLKSDACTAKELEEGLLLGEDGRLLIQNQYELTREDYYETGNNSVLATVRYYERLYPNSTVRLVSNNVGLRVQARTIGIIAENYKNDRLVSNLDAVYKGYKKFAVDGEVIQDFYQDGIIDIESTIGLDYDTSDIYVNEFLLLNDRIFPQNTCVARVVRDRGRLWAKKLIISDELYIYGIHALDVKQLMALELLLDPKVPFVTLLGKAGTGKTLLALAVALHMTMEQSVYKRILALRTLVEVGKKSLGFLPGELDDKLKPFMAPIYDNLEFIYDKKGVEDLDIDVIVEGLKPKLQIESTGFMRGRTLPFQFILVDEAQNLTKHEVKTLITRIGEGGKIVLLGDPKQIDDPYLGSVNNGLVYATERLKHLDISGTVLLDGRSKRSELAELAAELL